MGMCVQRPRYWHARLDTAGLRSVNLSIAAARRCAMLPNKRGVSLWVPANRRCRNHSPRVALGCGIALLLSDRSAGVRGRPAWQRVRAADSPPQERRFDRAAIGPALTNITVSTTGLALSWQNTLASSPAASTETSSMGPCAEIQPINDTRFVGNSGHTASPEFWCQPRAGL